MSDTDDLNNNPSKAAADFMYPDGQGGPVQAGLPGQPTARPAGYESSTEGTGVTNGVAPSDITGMAAEGSGDTRRTLSDWLSQQTQYNITPTPTGAGFGDGTIDTNSQHHQFVDPAEITTVYSQDPNAGAMLNTQQLPYGPRGNANSLLKNVTGQSLEGAYLKAGEEQGMQTDVGRTSEVLQRNRFNPSYGRRTESGNVTSQASQKFERTGAGTVASALGRYDTTLNGLAMVELQNVAEQLLLNAVGDKTTPFGDSNKAMTDFGEGKPLPFGKSTQLGRNRENFNADTDFRAANAVKAVVSKDRKNTTNILGPMATVDTPVEDLPENKDHIRTSYGTLNNHLEPFRPGLPISMILLAAIGALAALIIALIIAAVLDLLGVLVSLAGGTIPPGNGLVPYPAYQISSQDQPDPSKLPKGYAFGNDDYGNADFFAALGKWLQIPALEAEYPIPWLTCLTATATGVIEFFIGNSFSFVAIPQIATNAAGYYVTVIRNAMRDFDQVTNAFDNMGSGAGAVEGFFALIEAFTTSATFKFVTTCMQIGDRVMCGQGLFGLRDNQGNLSIDRISPENAPGPISITNLHKSSRRKSNSPRQTYSFTSLPQVWLRPKEDFDRFAQGGLPLTHGQPSSVDGFDGESMSMASIATTDILFEDSVSIKGENDQSTPFFNKLTYVEGGRIPTKFREEMEALLNSYYVPFYFHDLRTNEIMPLPAFVDGISDSYSPSWTEQKAFGRADPVQIYGGTTRKIGFSFYMVATNKQDYSALYYGINKLVSMVYPQWGGGDWITNAAGQQFKKPYSMIQTSSPLVRLRLGELFSSNRTPETVRRLFGANNDKFALGKDPDGVPLKPTRDLPPVNKAALEQVMGRARDDIAPEAHTLITATITMSGGGEVNPLFNFAGCNEQGEGGALTMAGAPFLLPVGTLITCSKGKYKRAKFEGLGFKLYRMKKFKFQTPPVFKIINYAIEGGKGKVAAQRNGGHLKNDIYYIVQKVDAAPAGTVLSAFVEATALSWEAGETKLDDEESSVFAGLAVPIKDGLSFNPTVPTGLIIPPFPPPPEPPTPITDETFFENNLMVDAMRESGGAGIAGAITSLDFNWNDAPWETDESLGRAPTWVKVTLSFSPIHDEPLGLNPDGSLRAGAYPVGKLMEKVFGQRHAIPGDAANALSRMRAAVAQLETDRANAETSDSTETPDL